MVNEPGELGSIQEENQEKELLEKKLGEGSVVPCDVHVCVERNKNGVPQSNTKDLKCILPLCIRVVASMHVAMPVYTYTQYVLASSPGLLCYRRQPRDKATYTVHTYLTDTQAIKTMHAHTYKASSHTSGVSIWFGRV